MVSTYESPLRAQQAAQTRLRIVSAAAELFARFGYAGTSLADIGRAAGVSVETVKLNGPKSALLLGAFSQAFSGSEAETTIHERDTGQAIIAIEDNDALIDGYVEFIAAANERTSALWVQLLAAAAADAEIHGSLDALLERRRDDFRASIELFAGRGMIAAAAPAEELAAVLSFLVSPESHAQLVGDSGLSPTAYRRWLAEMIRRVILST